MTPRSHQYVHRQTRLFRKAERYIRCRNRRRLFDLISRHPELLRLVVNESSLLALVVWWNQYEMAEGILRRGANPDLAEEGGNTLLIHTAAENDVRMARLLLDYGADLERPNRNFETPLGYACAYNSVDVVRLLCERGANVNGTEGWGKSYLYGVQCETQHPEAKPKPLEIERILISYGAKVILETPKLTE
ncbi:MAG: hypothetical protein JWM11_5068 [Planctomycetaceae bacterium]|nr:hypothetical protein [Planctomycetaceae bacterium]